MNDNIASLARPSVFGPVFWSVFLAVFLFTCLISTMITFLLPEAYASTARVKIPNITPVAGQANYDPYALQTSAEIIASDMVLRPVIDKLDLNSVWGKKFNNGEPFKSNETLEILRGRLEIRPVKNTVLVGIKVYSDDSKEAAQIANAIAISYRDYQQSNATQLASAYAVFYQKHGQSMSSASAQNNLPAGWREPVQITDPAIPGHAPVRPNKPLNIVIGSGLGLLLGAISAILASAMAIKLRRPLRPAAML